jgi:hypothetical protein
MKTKIHLMKLLAALTVLAAAASARALTIVPTFDSSITGDPNAAAMEAAINAAIQIFQSTYTDNVTVKITFVSDPNVGLGQSDTFYFSPTYSAYHTALKGKAADANDTNALSKLPSGTHDPVISGTQVMVTTALYRCLGLGSYTGTDSTISFNPDLVNLTRPGTDPENYDLQEVMEHEIDEALGTSSALFSPSTIPTEINAIDLFRYDTNLNRTFTTSGDNAYFSVDGTNLWARYNMDPGGDYADWWSLTGYWAPPGKTAGPQVQDAYATSGQYEDIGINEKAMLDVVGWTLAVQVVPTNPVISIARSGTNHIKISWPTNSSQFTLQESTNLKSPVSWVASPSGSTNPAIILSSSVKKFYRVVYQPPLGSVVVEQSAASPSQSSSNPPVQLQTRTYHPYKF